MTYSAHLFDISDLERVYTRHKVPLKARLQIVDGEIICPHCEFPVRSVCVVASTRAEAERLLATAPVALCIDCFSRGTSCYSQQVFQRSDETNTSTIRILPKQDIDCRNSNHTGIAPNSDEEQTALSS